MTTVKFKRIKEDISTLFFTLCTSGVYYSIVEMKSILPTMSHLWCRVDDYTFYLFVSFILKKNGSFSTIAIVKVLQLVSQACFYIKYYLLVDK